MPEPMADGSDPSQPTLRQVPASAGQSSAATAPTLPPDVLLPPAPQHAAALPRYRPLRLHARGGLGVVHVAEDQELHREVALKCMQAENAGSFALRRRFLVEAEVTARLQHPGVVPVYGLVEDGAGNPWYAMRFIEGESLAEAIKQFHACCQGDKGCFNSLEFRHLLQRFISVCNTIAYAHSRGIIHRDLKPANIMLGKYGETLVVDWGLARPVGRTEVERSLGEETTLAPSAGSGEDSATQLGQAVGTPAYMSPEQAAGRWDVIGPPSDIYSLGATLYVLLTNTLPFRETDPGLLMFAVQQGEFQRPRQVNPRVPAALEAICLKAMARKPNERYATALDLAADLDRWLADEPVSARAEPLRAKTRRWVRKHPGSVAGIAAAVFVGLLGLGISSVVLGQKNHELELARQAEAERADGERQAKAAAEQALKSSEEARRQAEAVSGFLVDAFRRPDPANNGSEVKVVDVLENALKHLDEFAGTPAIKGELLNALGQTYRGLGLPAKAVEVYEKARDVRLAALGPDHPDTLTSMNNLGLAYYAMGRQDEAIRLLADSLKRRKAKLGPEHDDTLLALSNLAAVYSEVGRAQEGVPLLEEVLRIRKMKLGLHNQSTMTSMNNLATAYRKVGRRPEAIALLKESLELQQAKLGGDHPNTLATMNNLAATYEDDGRLAEAIALYESALKLKRTKLGHEHPSTLAGANNLARAYQSAGRLPEALPLLEETFKLAKNRLGPDHPSTLGTFRRLVLVCLALGDETRAETLCREVLSLRSPRLRTEDPSVAFANARLGALLLRQKKFAEAEPFLLAAYEWRKAQNVRRANSPTLADSQQDMFKIIDALVELYDAWGQKDKADAWREKLKAAKANQAPAKEEKP
jgi:eukaryotic-like serine/threonine-protein kinase